MNLILNSFQLQYIANTIAEKAAEIESKREKKKNYKWKATAYVEDIIRIHFRYGIQIDAFYNGNSIGKIEFAYSSNLNAKYRIHNAKAFQEAKAYYPEFILCIERCPTLDYNWSVWILVCFCKTLLVMIFQIFRQYKINWITELYCSCIVQSEIYDKLRNVR